MLLVIGLVALLGIFAAAALFASRPSGEDAVVAGTITLTPNTFRCDGSSRTSTVRLLSEPSQIAMELRSGGLSGPIFLTGTTTPDQLGVRQADGSFKSTSSYTDSWECLQPSGRYGLILLDPTTGEILASGEFSIEN